MATAGGLLLAVACIAIVAVALGLAVASWDAHTPTWAPRILRGTAVTVGVTCLLLATIRPATAVLALLP